MTALKRSLEIKLENILLLKKWQLVGHLLKFESEEILNGNSKWEHMA